MFIYFLGDLFARVPPCCDASVLLDDGPLASWRPRDPRGIHQLRRPRCHVCLLLSLRPRTQSSTIPLVEKISHSSATGAVRLLLWPQVSPKIKIKTISHSQINS